MQVLTNWSEVFMTAPLLALVVGSLVPISLKVFLGNKEQPLFATLAQGLIAVLVAMTFVVAYWNNQTTYAFSESIVFDGLSSWAVLLTLITTGFALILMHDNLQTRDHQFAEQVSLLLSSAAGMMVVAWSNDLIVTFIGIELMSLCAYVVIGLGLEQRLSKEAAFKYFVLGSFGSAFILYGTALVYGTAETTMLSRIADSAPALMASNRLFVIGMIMLVSGVLFKISVFPFHAWTPDVYQGAPTPITAFMAAGVKLVMFIFFGRLALTGFMSGSEKFTHAMEWLAVLTVLAGNLAALRQNFFKRMLAYSSVAHSGYLLIGIIAVGLSEKPADSMSAIVFYLFTYTLMTLGTFGLASLYEKTENAQLRVDDLKGLGQRRPVLAFTMTLLLLSVAGIPPLAGFFGKLYLFSAAIAQGLFWPVIWGVIGSVIGVVYYLRPIVYMYMYEPASYFEEPLKYMGTRFVLFVAAVSMVLIGLISSPVMGRIQASVLSLF